MGHEVHSISADYDRLMRQAAPTISLYANMIKDQMGVVWVEQNPTAFAILVHACSIDFLGATIGKEIGKLADAVQQLTAQLEARD